MISWVPSVDPVSTITQVSIRGRTDSRQRLITAASFFTIMFRQIFAFKDPVHGGGEDDREATVGIRPRGCKEATMRAAIGALLLGR
ncbi:hypothetical protein GCM10010215_10550 [Streptomyces virginiae]|uniref:Uncharacterized protein n=1 Tax=Streptomyces virginiae TaxID=1961 RepID=A0ABQ3NUI0_STRVG|nr:hypothetical protein GCM10010215_10550 [Streptomyces virginiae]GHI16438.1 hypothetical protein Scinn_59010 [Streptomyces virginiae]GLV89672.1 hypothetical protein Slala04_11260 [Streptomyces lavendulae subsp. lavendulae]